MFKYLIAAALLLVSSFAHAQTLNLTTPRPLNQSTAPKLVWDGFRVTRGGVLRVFYNWVDASGSPIPTYDGNRLRLNHVWDCRDIEVSSLPVSSCIAASDPEPCCTGPGNGTCDDLVDSCFTDVFRSAIQCPRDDGVIIGGGLRRLIWSKMKGDVLDAGNDGTFE